MESVGEIIEIWATPTFVDKDVDDVPSTTTLLLQFRESFRTIWPAKGWQYGKKIFVATSQNPLNIQRYCESLFPGHLL